MRRAKRDAIHMPCTHALERAGRSVLDLSPLGNGAPDALVGWGLVHMVLMEFKTDRDDKGGGKYGVQPNQAAWYRTWRGRPVLIIKSVKEALAATGVQLEGGGGK